MKRFHPALLALTIIGSTVMATATRAETQDTGHQGNAQYARPYHDQYARPYHYRYARPYYARPYYRYAGYARPYYARPYYQYAGLYNYGYARPYVYGYAPAYNYRYARPYNPTVYYDYAPGGY